MNKTYKLITSLIILVILGATGWMLYSFSKKDAPSDHPLFQKPLNNMDVPPMSDQASKDNQTSSWQSGKAVISGQYADADVVEIEKGKFRMYWSEEPETPGFKGRVYSAVSTDGINWTKEDGIRMEWAVFPSVIKLPDGKFRMYYQKQEVIKSALSADGLFWTEEPGIRIDKINAESLNLENVAAPTVMKIGEGYIIVYRGTINQKYTAMVPNNNTQLFLWAVSQDGLTFEKKGLALDSRNSVFSGLLDGPDLVEFDNAEIRLYFWSYRGVYHAVFADNKFSNPRLDYTNTADSKVPFPENPPCDPTLVKIGNEWLMYYGQHSKGIYYTISKEPAD